MKKEVTRMNDLNTTRLSTGMKRGMRSIGMGSSVNNRWKFQVSEWDFKNTRIELTDIVKVCKRWRCGAGGDCGGRGRTGRFVSCSGSGDRWWKMLLRVVETEGTKCKGDKGC